MKTSASVYAANPLNIEQALLAVMPEIESLHFDVMDGHYTQAYGLNSALFKALKTFTDKPIDVHVMATNPDIWAEKFAALGARWVAFHPECCDDPQRVMQSIQIHGAKAYLAFNLDIQPADYQALLTSADGVLILSAPAGGGEFDRRALEKIKQIPATLPIAFDGKITPQHFPLLRQQDDDVAIMGAAIFAPLGHQSVAACS